MTISTSANTVTVSGNGVTTTFNFSFIAGVASNISVIYTDASGNETTLLKSQYTLAINAPATGQIWGVGGTVTYPLSGSPIAAGTTLTITRTVPLTQTTSISNQGDFYPAVVEKAIDTLEMQIQQISESQGRAIVVPIVDTVAPQPLPAAAQRANQGLAFDSTGQPIAGALPSAPVSVVMQPVFQASSLAIARNNLGVQAFVTRSLSGSTAGGTATASWTAKELTAETALDGTAYKGANLTLSFNGATTGAGGMDTGAMPTGGDLSVYAIYNPTTATWNTLGCKGSTSNGPVYSGANMPAGYTASALIWVGVTDSSAHFQQFSQRDRTIWTSDVVVLNGGTATVYTSFSVSIIVPGAATAVAGIVNGQAGIVFLAADTAGTGAQFIGFGSTGIDASFTMTPLLTAQTLFYKAAAGATAQNIYVNSYQF